MWVVTVAVFVADSPVSAVNHDFTPLILSNFTGTLNGLALLRMNRRVPTVAFPNHCPTICALNYVLIDFHSHLVVICFLRHLAKESAFASFDQSIRWPLRHPLSL